MRDVQPRTTSDAQDLAASFEAGRLVRPRSGAPTVVDLSVAVFNWAGVNSHYLNENATCIGAHFADASHLVFFVVDGLGTCFVQRTAPSSILREHMVAELQTVFPSTTPAVMTSLATAAWPNTHGVVGWDMYLDEIDAISEIIMFHRRDDEAPLDTLGVSEEQAYPLPSLCGAIEGELYSVMPRHLTGTAFSNYWTGRNAKYAGYESLSEGIEQVLSIAVSAGPSSVTCLYTDIVDAAAHRFGVDAPETHEALRLIEVALERLSSGLPAGVRIVLTADHGLLDGPINALLPADPVVRHLRHEPWGDARQMHFAVLPESAASFEVEFREQFGHIAFLLTVNEVEELELFGPGDIQPAAWKRLGTHLAIARGAEALEYTAGRESPPPIGIHSGLTPDEMLVPLIVV